MDDLISRKDAIVAIEKAMCEDGFRSATGLIHKTTAYDILWHLPSAQPEYKKGKWIEVHGYATPGGDPVWGCSECGKGQHVYGIEHGSYGASIADHQWAACPNCGAVMTEEVFREE